MSVLPSHCFALTARAAPWFYVEASMPGARESDRWTYAYNHCHFCALSRRIL